MERIPQSQDEALDAKLKALGQAQSLKAVPGGLTDRILARVYAPGEGSFWNGWLPVPALALAFLALGVWIGREWPRTESRQSVVVRFVLDAPRAGSVALAGDFTAWRPVPLQRANGRWELAVEVPRSGRQQYIFILNGRVFVVDPGAEMEEDGRGNLYSVVDMEKVKPKGGRTI